MVREIITKQIDSIRFGVVSPKHAKRISTVAIVTPELYDADGYPVDKGLMDPLMGVIDPGLRCKTCGGRLKTCLGHFGHIQLAKPVLHMLYVKYIHQLLQGFCKECGRILFSQKDIDLWKGKVSLARREGNKGKLNSMRESLVKALKQHKVCPYCKKKQGEIKLDKPYTFMEGDTRLWPSEIRERLEKIPDADLQVLGMDTSVMRPEWMVLTLLLVPPIAMRPSITLQTGDRSEDDLTHKLSDVVRVNQRLVENINAGAPEIIIEDLWDLLQYHVTTFFNNEVAQIPPARHRTNRELRTLAQRLKGKEGRFRYNLAGKRVNFAGRTVITPDPNIALNEVGVPEIVARELTVPERVTEWNVEWLKKLIKNGSTYPGANYVVSPDDKRKKITGETKEALLEELESGWVVERHLLDGDIAVFNRQPSLHRLSMMGHKVRVLPGRTFRINPSVTIPYNADFDGDEMNLHVPQTEEARSETINLLGLDKNIITPRYGQSIIGERQDISLGLYVLTSSSNKISKRDASDILIQSGADVDLSKLDGDSISGKELFSLILPEGLNFSEQGLKIENSKLLEGALTTKFIGPEGGSLVHWIFRKYGSARTLQFLNEAQQLGLAVTRKLAYTFSFFDLDVSKSAKKRIDALLDAAEEGVDDVLKKARAGKIPLLPGKTTEETTEAEVLRVLNTARNEVGKVIEGEATEQNNLVKMSKGGAGGKLLNWAQMAGFVGQQSLRGERISIGYEKRTLPHFERSELKPKARGFVRNCYMEGLDPEELFFNAIVGRDSYMDTAMRTPKSGYMQRRLINALQDFKVAYDGTVRDSSQRIVQFHFGGDAIDVSKSDAGGLSVERLK